MKRLGRAEIVLPVTIVIAAVVLGASQFMTMFELTPPGAEPLLEVTAADQHSYWLLLPAVFAVAATFLAIGLGERTLAFAAAGFGVAALLLFLIIDLPDAGKLGTLGGDSEFTFSTAKAEPQAGFVLEAIGSVVLALATVAFATLRTDQLKGARRTAKRNEETEDEPKPANRSKSRHEDPPRGNKPRGASRSRVRGSD